MSYSVGDHFESFIKKQVQDGRYNNSSEVVREGLRLVEEREAKLYALRNHVQTALAEDGAFLSDEEMALALTEDLDSAETF